MTPVHSLDISQALSGRLRSVGSCVVIRRGRLLMVQQGRRHKSGKWNLPGGKVDTGESLVDAAVRETLEETGLRVRPVGIAGFHHFRSKKGKPTLQLNVFATVVGGRLRCDGREILDVDWIDLEDAIALPDAELCKPDVMRPTLQRLAVHIRRPAPMISVYDFATVASDASAFALAG